MNDVRDAFLVVGVMAITVILLLSCASTKHCPCQDDIEVLDRVLDSTQNMPSYERLFILRGKIEVMKLKCLSEKQK